MEFDSDAFYLYNYAEIGYGLIVSDGGRSSLFFSVVAAVSFVFAQSLLTQPRTWYSPWGTFAQLKQSKSGLVGRAGQPSQCGGLLYDV